MKYMLIAGEASGDLHAAGLIEAIRARDPQAEFRFFGGDLMTRAARRNPDLHYDMMNVMGFSEVLRKLPVLWRNLRQARRLMEEFRPDVFIPVDYPSFNLKLAAHADRLGIPVHYFISPKVWAWKEFRVKQIKKYVDAMYSILPFEVPFYAQRGYKATYVGNPSVREMDDCLGHIPPVKHFLERQGLAGDSRPLIALLPGSRRGEIRNNLPLMIQAAKEFPEFRYVVAAAPAIPEKFYRQVAQDPGLAVVFGCTPTLLKYSKAALVTSGTATLETALMGTPQVVCYRANGSKLSYKIMEKLLKVKYVSLPNLVVNNNIVPELLVHRCTVRAIVRELGPLLQASPQRDWQLSGYKAMRRKLGTSVAADYAADLLVESLSPAGGEPSVKGGDAAPRRRRAPGRSSGGGGETGEERSSVSEEARLADEAGGRPRRRRRRTRPAAAADISDGTPKTEEAPVSERPARRRRHRPSKSSDQAASDAARVQHEGSSPKPQPAVKDRSQVAESGEQPQAVRRRRRRPPRRKPQEGERPSGAAQDA